MGSTSTATEPTTAADERVVPDLGAFVRLSEKRGVYWLGVFPFKEGDPKKGIPSRRRPPAHQFDGIGGGVTFAEWFTPPEGVGQDGAPRRGQYAGNLVEMTETQVAQLRAGLRRALVRWRSREGANAHGYPVRIPDLAEIEETKQRLALNDKEVARAKLRASQFQAHEGDDFVANYVYCVKVTGPEAVAGGTWRPSTELPKSVAEQGFIEAP